MKGKIILLLLSLMTFTTSMAQDDNVLSCPDDNHPYHIFTKNLNINTKTLLTIIS